MSAQKTHSKKFCVSENLKMSPTKTTKNALSSRKK